MGYDIPLFDLNFGPEEEQALVATLRSGWISTGPRCAEFETNFAEALGCAHAVSLSSCTAALHLALVSLGVGPGDEVIVPALNYVAGVNSIRYVGATPVFCDIRGDHDLTLDPEALAGLVTKRTRAIMVMHYGGFPCDMAAVLALARKHDLRVIEDACHGPLSEYDGRKLGTLGDVGCFSFYTNKNMSTAEGGMLVTDHAEVYERVKLIRSHAMTSLSHERAQGATLSYDVLELGYNYRMDDLRASLGIVQLAKLRQDLEARAAVRAAYQHHLAGIDEVIIPFADRTGFVSNYIFAVLLRDSDAERRDHLREALKESGIQTSVHYPAAHRFSMYEHTAPALARTEYASDNEVTLPMYARLDEGQVRRIAGSLRDFFKWRGSSQARRRRVAIEPGADRTKWVLPASSAR